MHTLMTMPRPLNEPAVPPSHIASRLLSLAHDAGVAASIVVLGTRGRWWQPGSPPLPLEVRFS